MENKEEKLERIVVACPKCGQKLRCEPGAIGTCPKCRTKLEFPMEVPYDNREAKKMDIEEEEEEEGKKGKKQKDKKKAKSKVVTKKKKRRKKGSAGTVIIIILLLLILLGGAGFAVWFFVLQDKQAEAPADVPAEEGEATAAVYVVQTPI